MSLRVKCLLIGLLAASLLASCGEPAPSATLVPTPTVAIYFPRVEPSPTASPLPASPTPLPTRIAASATPTAKPVAPTPAPAKIDLKLATLRLENLPKGFQALDEKSQAQAGLAPDAIRQSFSGIFRQAELIHSFAFVTSDPKAFEIVVGLVFSPILPVEQPSFDQMVADPNGAVKNFAKNFGGEAKMLAHLPAVGDCRTGWSFNTASGSPPLKGEMMIARRETIVALLLTMFPSDQTPAAPVDNLAQTLDGNMKKALGK